MKKHYYLFSALLIITLSIIGCKIRNQRVDYLKEEKFKITKTINAVIGWAANKDTGLLFSAIAHDSNFLEIHPTKHIVKGIKQFKGSISFFLSPDFKAVKYEIHDLQINVSETGTVAWFYCTLNDINEWKGQPANWENTRWTGVLEKRNGKWKMVQQHFSFAKE